MAKIIFGMNQSLDGYVDHDAFGPDAVLFQHFIDQARGLTGSIYGRRLYEIMRYWDTDDAGWGPDYRAFAEAWRAQRKWVVSGTLSEVGPNAELIAEDVAAAVRRLKDEVEGEIEVGGPVLARSLTDWGLIDEYQIFLHPVVLGQGKAFFQGPRPPLRLVSCDRIGGEAVRLVYVPVG
ncbi:MAG: dihydrofolate reductase family protein [Paracoccaceae bacterium]